MKERVLILGGTSDLATELAHGLAKEGKELIIGGRRTEELSRTSSDISVRYNVKCDYVYFDAEKFDSHDDFFKNIEGSYPTSLFVVFGYLGDQMVAETNKEESFKIINRNFTGAVSIINSYLTQRGDNEINSIVGVTSVAGDRGRMSNFIYGSSKAGFTAYLSGLRNKLFHENIHVMTVRPGFMDTKMTEGMDLPGPLTASPDKAARLIIKSWKRKRNNIYVLPLWRYIMLIIKNIPEGIFKRLKM
ncbi:SDR family oxidoreductase [Mangrovivirga sp. M17]|uniref:SDR family oxidoreductase n=1 Tax=Mangrovivirga halotolerans TaxID=2993936 RepID=A0ABT3RWC1_9BACT|nr:SDR family oxidoreductase [Mangrovivirga halotolerans]MCX2745857.1 SDR family oxidoreductase [Mangrovivirga halotolerans]